jgi:hypothetical protein
MLILHLQKKISVLICYVLCQIPEVVAIASTTQSALKYEDVVSSLLSKEMRRKSMDSHSTNDLFVRVHPKDRDSNKSSGGGGRSKSKGRSKSPGKYLRKC